MSAEKTVTAILSELKRTFNGLEDEAASEFFKIMITRVRAFGEAVRKEALAQSGGAEGTAKQPKLKRVTNYTMFGNWFREQNTDIPAKEMFERIGQEWKGLSDEKKAEWKTKANEQNETYRKEYIEKYGSLPVKGKLRKRPKTTNGFQQFVADFRTNHPDVNHKEVFSKAADEWKTMKPKDKKKYEDRAAKLKEQYREEFEQLKRDHPEMIDQTGGKRKKNNEPHPKILTGYILFGNHWREKLNKDKLTGKSAMTAIGQAWRKQTKAAQEKFKKEARTQNEGEIETFLKENGDSAWAARYRKRQEKASS